MVCGLLQSSHLVFCSFMSVFVFPLLRKLVTEMGKYLSPHWCKCQTEGNMASLVTFCLTGTAEKKIELSSSDRMSYGLKPGP